MHPLQVKQSAGQLVTFLIFPVGLSCRHQYSIKYICDFNTLCKDREISSGRNVKLKELDTVPHIVIKTICLWNKRKLKKRKYPPVAFSSEWCLPLHKRGFRKSLPINQNVLIKAFSMAAFLSYPAKDKLLLKKAF